MGRPWNVSKNVTMLLGYERQCSHQQTQTDVSKKDHNITTRIFVGFIQEEVATVELVDATDPGEHNGDTVTDAEAGLASRTNPLDDSTSQANVSIHYKNQQEK